MRSLPNRRDTGNWLDRACACLANHPRWTCAGICALPLLVAFLDGPKP